MGSERLPGKVLKKIGNETVLSHVINRVTKIKHIDNVVVATTKLKTDNKIGMVPTPIISKVDTIKNKNINARICRNFLSKKNK